MSGSNLAKLIPEEPIMEGLRHDHLCKFTACTDVSRKVSQASSLGSLLG